METKIVNTKIFTPVIPVGELFSNGKHYLLLDNEPAIAETWQRPNQQRWCVVPKIYYPFGNLLHTEIAIATDDFTGYAYGRYIVCTDPLIEFQYRDKPIWVQVGEINPDGEEVYFGVIS